MKGFEKTHTFESRDEHKNDRLRTILASAGLLATLYLIPGPLLSVDESAGFLLLAASVVATFSGFAIALIGVFF